MRSFIWHATKLAIFSLALMPITLSAQDKGKLPKTALHATAGEPFVIPTGGLNVAGGKELLQRAATANLTEQLASERDHFVENLFHPNGGEGLQDVAALGFVHARDDLEAMIEARQLPPFHR